MLCIAAATGCYNEDDATVVAIHAIPSAAEINAGEKMYVDIYVSTLNSFITEVTVSTFDSENGETPLMSASPDTKEYQTRMVYEAPSFSQDSTSVEFVVKASDDTGTSSVFTFRIAVKGEDTQLLQEMSSIVLYSPFSGQDDAFSFRTCQPLLSSAAEDKDIDLHFIHEGDDGNLPRRWGTKTDILFCKSNSFNYSSATGKGVGDIFRFSLRSNQVDDLETGDIIIVGRGTDTEDAYSLKALGVMKIMAVYDEPGSQSDRIVFNLKMI